MKKPSNRANKGFTLVELIVVLVILAILLAILVPSLTAWIRRAKEKQAEVNCRACVLAAQTLAVEKYGSDTLVSWYGESTLAGGGSDACRADILALADVPGSVAAVRYDSACNVTYLKYVYAAPAYVIFENGAYTFGPGSGVSAAASPAASASSAAQGVSAANGYLVVNGVTTTVPVSSDAAAVWTESTDSDSYTARYDIHGGALAQVGGSIVAAYEGADSLTGTGGSILTVANNWKEYAVVLNGRVFTPADLNKQGALSAAARGSLYIDGAGRYYVQIHEAGWLLPPDSNSTDWYLLPGQ